MKHLSEAQRIIIEAYKAGMSVEGIATSTGCTPMLVRRTLGDAGVAGRRRGRVWPYDAETEATIAADYAAGFTMAQLIARHGGSNRTIKYVLQHRGVTVRSRGRRPRAALPEQLVAA